MLHRIIALQPNLESRVDPFRTRKDVELRKLSPIMLLLAASGCQKPMPNAAADREGAGVMRGCDQTGRLLTQMAAAEKTFTYDAKGNATISRSLWGAMSPELQDGLVKAVAYHAICAAGAARSQNVTIRSSGDNAVLDEKTVGEFERAAAR